MLTTDQLKQVSLEVQNFVKAALAGEAPADAIATAAAIGEAIITKGIDPTADLAAIQALNKFNTALVTAFQEAKTAGV